MSELQHVRDRIKHHQRYGPHRHGDALPTATGVQRFNSWLAIKITKGVGTMWCAYAFALLALISLPNAIKGGTPTLISWIAQTLLQLVLLSVIIVGQNIAATASDKRAEETLDDTVAIQKATIELHALVRCVHGNPETGPCPGHPEFTIPPSPPSHDHDIPPLPPRRTL